MESSLSAPSSFAVELLDNPDDDNNLSGEGDPEVSPQCKFDVLLNWTGPFLKLLAYSRFLAYDHTTNNRPSGTVARSK